MEERVAEGRERRRSVVLGFKARIEFRGSLSPLWRGEGVRPREFVCVSPEGVVMPCQERFFEALSDNERISSGFI